MKYNSHVLDDILYGYFIGGISYSFSLLHEYMAECRHD